MVKLQNILCPTDFSELSVGAVNYAAMLAETFKARLHLLHVVDQAYQYWMATGPEAVPAAPAGPTPEELMETATKQMEDFASQYVPEKVQASGEVISGRPFLEIIRVAKEKKSDLIVIGTHGRGALRQVLLGSVAEKVVRKAPCPVLSVRDPGHKFIMP